MSLMLWLAALLALSLLAYLAFALLAPEKLS